MNSGFLERCVAESGDVLEAILTHSRECIKLIDRAGFIEYASASATDALGIAEGATAIGQPWREFWPESARVQIDRAVSAALNGDSSRFEAQTRGNDGNARSWDVIVSPVRGENGAVTHLIALSSDVTAQREAAEQALEQAAAAERRANFAADVARELRHRIKNQLAVVNAVTKLLARHTLSARDLARKLEEKLISLGQAQDLLARHHEHPITVREAVSEILRASGAGDRVDVGEVPDTGLPDESIQQLALLLGELQTNALKHGALRDDGGSVRLTGVLEGEAVTLRWEEDCRSAVAPTEAGNGGFQLIRRLGSAAGRQPSIDWQANGIVVEIHVRAAR